jgi:cytochrome P450
METGAAAAGVAPIGDWAGADPFAPDFRDDPYPGLHILRERQPVNLTPVGTWRISRYDDVQTLFKKVKTGPTSIRWTSAAASSISC